MPLFYIDVKNKSKERYDQAKFFEYQNDGYDPLTSGFLDAVMSLPESGVYTVQGEDGRPDLISYRIYEDTQYWWILLYYNNKLEFDEFKTGDKVKYPSVSSIEDIYFGLKAKQTGVGK